MAVLTLIGFVSGIFNLVYFSFLEIRELLFAGLRCNSPEDICWEWQFAFIAEKDFWKLRFPQNDLFVLNGAKFPYVNVGNVIRIVIRFVLPEIPQIVT